MKKITIDPRVVKHLGRDLITTSDVAVIELVKNSIDAIDGSNGEINLRIYNDVVPNFDIPSEIIGNLVPFEYYQKPFLVVEDNGRGMTGQELDKGFLTIGTNIKANDDQTLGEKGIGRLAAQRLGASLLVETSSAQEDHTSFIYINWNDVIRGATEVPSFDGPKTSPHTRLWIFGIDLDDYIDNAMQFSQTSLITVHNDIQINRDLKSALNFLISPFIDENTYGSGVKKPQINFWFDENLISIDFPMDTLSLAESTHRFSYTPVQDELLHFGLTIEPWFIERVHRAIVKADAFKRLKKPHQFYDDLLKKNKHRIDNALTGVLSKEEIFKKFYEVLSDFYAVKGDEKKQEAYDSFLSEKASSALENLDRIAPISGAIYSFKQGAAIGDNIIIDSAVALNRVNKRYKLNDLKYFLEDYNGIKLYRGFYRIGFLGNKESDWIKLQQFRTKGQQWYRFDLGNTVGYVSLSDAAQQNIQEISSRLDISENDTSESFKLLINIIFNYLFYDLNRKANDLIKNLLFEEGLLEETLAKRVKKNNDAIKEMMSRNRFMQKSLNQVSQQLLQCSKIENDCVALPTKTYQSVINQLESIFDGVKKDFSAQESTATLLSEADAQLKAIEVESYNNYKLMANGLITETITHELHSVSKTGVVPDSSLHFDALKDYFVQTSTVKVFNQHVYPIQNSYNSIAGKLSQVGDLYSFLETTFIKKGTYDEFTHQNIKSVIDDIKLNLIAAISKDKIEIICETGNLTWFVPKGVLLHVFYNLINNSMYWIDIRRKRAQNDSIYKVKSNDVIVVEEHGADGLIVYDSGTGVSKSMEDLLFEPLQSGKPLSEGRGMGLYIVRKLLQSFGGDIELLGERNQFGNRYKFLIMSSTEEDM